MRLPGAKVAWRASVIAAAILVGTGSYTFWFARGYSYLLDDPEVCINCHIMRDNYHSWDRSSHQEITCNDCHVPHTLVAKWLTKAENGFHHSVAFTFGPPEVIHARPRTRRLIQRNCLYCHGEMVMLVRGTEEWRDRFCFDCHRGVGHAY
ncbi:MAG: cytochrome c nitrite reductase small subunit [Armatimonadetes bacterium]|jgi:cytochrome c nitrite reductase small subunit|nr:cytochrome c nitrite reductase small subunit [Armatimonadota bacterium]